MKGDSNEKTVCFDRTGLSGTPCLRRCRGGKRWLDCGRNAPLLLQGWSEGDGNGVPIDGTIYDFTDEGYLKGTGSIVHVNADYLLDTDNNILTGWQTVDGKKYYFFPESGMRLKEFCIYTIDGIDYLFGGDGHLLINEWYSGYMSMNGVGFGSFYGDEDGHPLDGYQTVDGKKYYFKNGCAQNGFQTIDGKLHYFDSADDFFGRGVEIYGWLLTDNSLYYFDPSTGIMQTSNRTIDGVTYVFGDNGKMAHNDNVVLHFADGSWHGYDANNSRLQGWYQINGNQYYFGYYNAYTGSAAIDEEHYYFDQNGVMQTGWHKYRKDNYSWNKEGWFYHDTEGKALYGLQRIGEDIYYIDEYYGMKTGSQDIYDSDVDQYFCYYFDENGKMQTGWVTIKGSDGIERKYYYGTDGRRITGWQQINGNWYYLKDFVFTDSHDIGDNHYYFDQNGVMQTGWLKYRKYNYSWNEEGEFYHNADGKALYGLQKIGENTYYIDSSKGMQTGSVSVYDADTDQSFNYYFDADGKMQTGWVTIKDANGTERKYYYGTDGKQLNGFQVIDGETYYLSSYMFIGTADIYNEDYSAYSTYYFDENGKMQTGWQTQKYDGEKEGLFYYDKDGKRQTGWVTVDGKTYYIDSWNGLYKDCNSSLDKDGQYRRFYFDKDGVLLNDLVYLGRAGWMLKGTDWYYGDENGYAINGPLTVDECRYCFDENGRMITGWAEVFGKWYYAESTGILPYRDQWAEVDGVKYYFRYDGTMATGWVEAYDYTEDVYGKYYLNESGAKVIGWYQIDGDWYLFGPDGRMQTGWIQDGSNWYYLKPGGALAFGWAQIDGQWYYFKDSGAMAVGWTEIDGDWYYLESSTGQMESGWKEIDGKWYFLNSDGIMVTGWMQDSGVWYYFLPSGEMATDWAEADGYWYYFDDNGNLVTGWVQYDGAWYYFGADGYMVTGWVQIDGQWEFFNNGGAWEYSWQGN